MTQEDDMTLDDKINNLIEVNEDCTLCHATQKGQLEE